jgi:hypothetical protein
MGKKKKVRFSFPDNYITFSSDKDENMLSSEYVRGLVPKCTQHQDKIRNLIEINLGFCFVVEHIYFEADENLIEDTVDSIHVKTESLTWDEDNSPIMLHESLLFDQNLETFCSCIKGQVETKLQVGNIGEVTCSYGEYEVTMYNIYRSF